MLVYEATKKEFLNDVLNDKIAPRIYEKFKNKVGNTSKNEIRSWENSMQFMFKVLSDSGIPTDCGVAIEFKIPYTSKRVDFLLSGRKKDLDAVVIVELKQWETANKVEGKEAIIETYIGGGLREVTHPSYQAWSYASLIADYNENVQDDNIALHPCAYLHNYIGYEDDPLVDSVYSYYLNKAPVFRKGDARKLQDFIKRYITIGDNKGILYKIDNGRIRPSKSLQDSLSSMIGGNQEFIMIDEQKVVYEQALELAKNSYKTGEKNVLIVQGGPGTGKSVLAINLLVELTNKDLVCHYVTKNSAPRNIYATKLKGDIKKCRIDNLFKGSGCYTDSLENEIDTLIVDEAHRLNEKSGMFQNLGENQIKEIINASKFSIFFIDERQKVTLKDIGSIDLICKFAQESGAKLHINELESQFRCNGSDGYLAWVDDVLEIRETANAYELGSSYDVRVFDDPKKMKCEIEKLNKVNNKARIVAGYCWNWIKEGKNYGNIHDIQIPKHDFSLSWNLGNSSTWAIDVESVNEAGCIHTCQGLEFDYVGVIIGEDLVFRNEHVLTDYTKRAKTDQSLKGLKKLLQNSPDEATRMADEIIRNTYRTLLTRGQKGCFIYCVDDELRDYISGRVQAIEKLYSSKKLVLNVAETKVEL